MTHGDALGRAMLALNGQRPQDAERIAGAVLEAEPRHAPALLIVARALLMQGRAQEAIGLLDPAARSRRDPEVETQLAMALRQVGRNEDALSRLRRAAKWRPAHAAAFGELGSLLVAMERYDEAIEALRKGLEAVPMAPDLSIQLGYVLLRCRKFSDAKAALGRALGIAPSSANALFGMAKTHQEIGENHAAVEYFRRCLRLRPDDAAAWLGLGHCLLELGERDAGYECFRAAARGDLKRYGNALASLVKSARGRFWLKPSAAARFLQTARR